MQLDRASESLDSDLDKTFLDEYFNTSQYVNYVGNKKNNLDIQSNIVSHHEKRFRKIMELDGLDPDQFVKSFRLEDNMDKVFKSGHGTGKSGSFFFYS